MNVSSNMIISIIQKYRIHLLIFGIALFLIISCTMPKMFVNDEWITANQLSQIDQGHQVITSEGKYGVFQNGTPGKYFAVRNNQMGYTLFLPLISLPALKFINLFGDSSLFFVVEFWTLLLIGIALFARQFFPEYSRLFKNNWTNITIIAAFILFFCNLIFYQPFILAGKDAHPEIAAVALTNAVLLAALTVILYALYVTMFQSQRISLSATIISIFCSSYLFWTTTAKDHMLMAFLFVVLLYCGIKYIYTHDRWYIPALFISIGWIAWGRAETAVPLYIAFIILVVIKCIMVIRTDQDLKNGVFFLLSPIFTIIGAIPLQLNNFFVSGNPLISTFSVVPGYRWLPALPPVNPPLSTLSVVTTSAPQVMTTSVSQVITTNSIFLQNIETGTSSLLGAIVDQYSLAPGTSVFDLFGILFLPVTRNIAVFAICPIIILGLAFAILNKIHWRDLENHEKKVILFLLTISLLIFIAYLSLLNDMNVNIGMIPDIRYLSPIYLPFSILGILLIQKCGILPTFSKEGLSVIIVIMSEIILVLITFLIIFKPADKNFQFYVSNVSETVTCITFALVVLCILAFFSLRDEQDKRKYSTLILHALIVVPLVWQLAMIFISGIAINNDGYTYWIPVVKYFMQHLQNFIV